MSKVNRLKLAKMIMSFGQLETDKAVLMYEGELAVGTEVFIEDENGEMIVAPDGEYALEDGTIYVVAEGKIAEVRPVEVEENKADEKPVEENLEEEPAEEDPKDKEIEALKAEKEDLEAKVNELSEIIKARDEEIEQLKNQLNMSAAKPAHKEIKDEFTINNKDNKALKYFQ